ncbi:hypothetical protein B0I35DRAFT_413118 [Stachybotrys elegans]|uniref:Uncharacterized protein n=1 Tax=Stachybotrys elegans TaxID=80388 RepID=A0A8K0WL98_9HYPO|nr:hypothetical protein B0I35DRAFT_413118 [Stachybotrys elegans]
MARVVCLGAIEPPSCWRAPLYFGHEESAKATAEFGPASGIESDRMDRMDRAPRLVGVMEGGMGSRHAASRLHIGCCNAESETWWRGGTCLGRKPRKSKQAKRKVEAMGERAGKVEAANRALYFETWERRKVRLDHVDRYGWAEQLEVKHQGGPPKPVSRTGSRGKPQRKTEAEAEAEAEAERDSEAGRNRRDVTGKSAPGPQTPPPGFPSFPIKSEMRGPDVDEDIDADVDVDEDEDEDGDGDHG